MVIATGLLILTALVGRSFQEVTNCSRIERPIPGSLCNISKNDPGVQRAVLSGTYAFNNQSNDVFLFKALEIDDAKRQSRLGYDDDGLTSSACIRSPVPASTIYFMPQTRCQIVKGIKYILEVQILRTVCRKTDNNDLNNCHFQPKGKLHQIFHCHFEVWAIPWQKLMDTTFFSCRP
ncbi:hypothetical protein SKAU_G00160890 [Synaphobranchus kaupii]|uniref:Cystatin domain-containing protein n=1 Tax=Synaphobranchus kaupii TaxID=118154 RepID=A0A9Q1IXM7_SYNKA|nr:hypothetical protein SKAU_G00160890 [Synaphobranchus kaupii]